MIETKTWEELSKKDLYDVLALRTEVFVVEQNCPYQELDGRDQLSLHFMSRMNDELAAYLRLIQPNKAIGDVWIGRVVVKKKFRGAMMGVKLMNEAISYAETHFPGSQVKISAQAHLQDYYGSQGFESVGKGYLEDNIPHIEMWLRSTDS